MVDGEPVVVLKAAEMMGANGADYGPLAARLSLVERAVRKVARMILAAHNALPAAQRPAQPDMRIVPIKDVEEALGVSTRSPGSAARPPPT
ncbi:hypothetical protein ACFU8I_31680 [Streptomyces sp. NPDC057540]|uniref:hypothetical protein n=1 Tax=Streptomyces sp. NPDC057540 TaxID=3346160 RepID=UPI00369F844F